MQNSYNILWGVGSLNDIKLALSSNIDAVACTSFFCFYGKNKSV